MFAGDPAFMLCVFKTYTVANGRRLRVHFEDVHMNNVMPRLPIEDNNRLSLRIPADEKSVLVRAAALTSTSLTDFVRRSSLEAAREIIRSEEVLVLSARDSQLVLDLLENPPEPTPALLAAAKALAAREKASHGDR